MSLPGRFSVHGFFSALVKTPRERRAVGGAHKKSGLRQIRLGQTLAVFLTSEKDGKSHD